MFFGGLWQRPSLLYCRPRSRPRVRIVWEEAWEEDTAACGWHRIFLAVADLIMHLDISTIVMTSLFGITTLTGSGTAILIAMTVSSFIITIVSSLLLISLHLASLGGTRIPTPMPTPTPTTTGTPLPIPLMTTAQVTITVIRPLWAFQCNRNLPRVPI